MYVDDILEDILARLRSLLCQEDFKKSIMEWGPMEQVCEASSLC